MGYVIGGITAAYYSNRWDENVNDADDYIPVYIDDDDVDDFKTIRNGLGTAAVSQFINCIAT